MLPYCNPASLAYWQVPLTEAPPPHPDYYGY